MPVRIRIYGIEASFSQGCWDCEDDSLRSMLEAMADPRARTPEEEHRHALYAAGRYGGLIAVGEEWQTAPHPDPEMALGDMAPAARATEGRVAQFSAQAALSAGLVLWRLALGGDRCYLPPRCFGGPYAIRFGLLAQW